MPSGDHHWPQAESPSARRAINALGPRAGVWVRRTKDATPRLSGARDFPTFHRGLRLRFIVERPRLPFANKQRAPSGGTRLGLNKVEPRGKGWS